MRNETPCRLCSARFGCLLTHFPKNSCWFPPLFLPSRKSTRSRPRGFQWMQSDRTQGCLESFLSPFQRKAPPPELWSGMTNVNEHIHYTSAQKKVQCKETGGKWEGKGKTRPNGECRGMEFRIITVNEKPEKMCKKRRGIILSRVYSCNSAAGPFQECSHKGDYSPIAFQLRKDGAGEDTEDWGLMGGIGGGRMGMYGNVDGRGGGGGRVCGAGINEYDFLWFIELGEGCSLSCEESISDRLCGGGTQIGPILWKSSPPPYRAGGLLMGWQWPPWWTPKAPRSSQARGCASHEVFFFVLLTPILISQRLYPLSYVYQHPLRYQVVFVWF